MLLAACCNRNPSDQIARLAEEFVYTNLSFVPSTATSVGLHQYDKQKLDELLDDISPSGLQRQRRFYAKIRERLRELKVDALNAADRADWSILLDQASSNLVSAPEIWTKVALEENQGNIDLVDKTIRAEIPPEMLDAFARA